MYCETNKQVVASCKNSDCIYQYFYCNFIPIDFEGRIEQYLRGGSGNQKLVRPIAAPNPFQKKECTKILVLSVIKVTDYVS